MYSIKFKKLIIFSYLGFLKILIHKSPKTFRIPTNLKCWPQNSGIIFGANRVYDCRMVFTHIIIIILMGTHNSAGFVVVQVHLLAEASAAFARVHKQPSELVSKIDIVRTSSPFPVLDARHRVLDVRATALVRGVTSASLYHALCARPGHRVRHARARDRVDERRLPETCHTRKRAPTQNVIIIIIIKLSAVIVLYTNAVVI